MNNTKGQRIGYIRVSSLFQNTDRQLDGVELDRTFTDKVSGKTMDRPALQEMLQFVREGDAIICHSLDRLGRNLENLRTIIREVTDKGVSINFMKEGLTFTKEEDNPMSNLLLNVMGAFAQFERELLKERQREGIQIAKEKGKYTGRKNTLSGDQVKELQAMIKEGKKKTEIAEHFGISRVSVYRYTKEWMIKKALKE